MSRKTISSARQAVKENNQNKDAVYSENGTITDITFQGEKLAYSKDSGLTYETVKTKEIAITDITTESVNGTDSSATSQKELNIENSNYLKQLQQNKIDAVKAVQRQGIGSPIPNEMLINSYLAISYVGEVNNQNSPTLPIKYDEEGLATFAVFYIPNSTVNGNAAQQLICMTPEQSAGRMFVRTANSGVWEEWKEMVNGNSMDAQFEIVNEKLDAIKDDTEKILELNNYDEGDPNDTIIVYAGTTGTNTIGITTTGHKILVNDVIITENSVANQTFTLSYPKNCVIKISGDVRLTGNVNYISVDYGTQVSQNLNSLVNSTNLTSVNVSRSQLTTMPTLSGCTKLTNVEVPNFITTLPGDCFKNTSISGDFYLPDSISLIQPGAFYGTKIRTIRIPDNCDFGNASSSSNGAFQSCTELVEFPNIKVITNYMFAMCAKLTGVIDLSECVVKETYPSGLYYTFRGCIGITKVILPLTYKGMGTSCFQDCTSLVEVVGAFTSYESYTFQNCTSLTTVDISQVTGRATNKTFDQCVSLKTLDFSSWVANLNYDNLYGTAIEHIYMPLYVGYSGDYTGFVSLANLKTIDLPLCQYLPYGVQSCPNVTSINIPNIKTVPNISGSAITELNIPNATAFANANCLPLSLTKIDIGDKITSMNFAGLFKANVNDCTIRTLIPPTIASTTLNSGLTTVKVPSSAVAAYQAKQYWNTKTIVGI